MRLWAAAFVWLSIQLRFYVIVCFRAYAGGYIVCVCLFGHWYCLLPCHLLKWLTPPTPFLCFSLSQKCPRDDLWPSRGRSWWLCSPYKQGATSACCFQLSVHVFVCSVSDGIFGGFRAQGSWRWSAQETVKEAWWNPWLEESSRTLTNMTEGKNSVDTVCFVFIVGPNWDLRPSNI